MPQPKLPPTPAVSTDITGQEKPHLSSPKTAFALPPPAIPPLADENLESSISSLDSASASSYDPGSPTSQNQTTHSGKSRLKRTSSGSKKQKDDFTLPPPPTRARKIIHMKPKEAVDSNSKTSASTTKLAPSGSTSLKRKQPSSTSVAGRKMARKTAHSLIERRRRSKMNEEFGILKDMIPACEGQDMHKLAILQASIDYVRYLENCVEDLKRANKTAKYPPLAVPAFQPVLAGEIGSPTTPVEKFKRPQTVSSHPSPEIYPSSKMHRRNDSFATSVQTMPSPDLERAEPPSGLYWRNRHSPYIAGSTTSISSASPSPNILPNPADVMEIERDQEATAALLMLTTDRRGIQNELSKSDSGESVTHRKTTGMSVKDLLST